MDTIAQIHAKVDALNQAALDALQADSAHALALNEEAIALATSLEPRYELGYARARAFQVEWYAAKGDYPKALQRASEIEALYTYLQPDRWLCSAYYYLGIAYYNAGHYALALESHQEQLALAHELDLPEYEASALRRIGVIHKTQNQLDLAMRYYAQSLAVYQQIGRTDGEAGIHNNLALIYLQQGHIEQALAEAGHALSIFDAKAFSAGQIAANTTLVDIYLAAGQVEAANRHAEAALLIARTTQRTERLVKSLLAKAEVMLHSSDPAAALPHLTEAMALAEQTTNRIDTVDCLKLMSRAYATLGDYQQALAYHEQYHDLHTELASNATEMRFEHLEIMHQTRQAQAEADTQRRLREEDRRYYEQLSTMKDDLLSTTSHDLKNPLASMVMMLYLLRSEVGEQARALKLIDTLEKNVEQMRTLVSDMLDLARLQTGAAIIIKQTDMVGFVEQTVSEFESQAAAKGLTLRFQTDTPAHVIAFDPKRMHQVLSNLLGNAIKYTPNGGITVRVLTTERGVRLVVADTGLGIPAGDLPHIFERFYRVQDERHAEIEGTGLGLNICQSIVEQHHGRIWVESTLGVGSQFMVELPAPLPHSLLTSAAPQHYGSME